VKRICVCCDGTWNAPDKTQAGVAVATNVVKVAEAIPESASEGTPQLVYYDAGIGTKGSWMRRAFDGATGTGMSANIREAYRYLIRHYAPGDELYFFGFSRGAFTVRSLAGLIRNSGLLRVDARDRVDAAYTLYRSRAPEAHPRAHEAMQFRRTYAVEEVTPIHFIGVWDTVGALGNPVYLGRALDFFGRRNQFHDTNLSSKVRHAYHAVAIDETRRHFAPTLWHQPAPVPGQRLEQVWFAGAHSNVGGGYPATGLSDLALAWMIGRARSAGLEVNMPVIRPDSMETPRDSGRGAYRLLPALPRPIAVAANGGATHERLHRSVLEKRQLDPRYRPSNLEAYLAGAHGGDEPAD
jgi:uncharacterized protein (DUF2235 family)